MKKFIKKSIADAEKSLEKNHPEIANKIKHYQTVAADKESEVKAKMTDLSLQSAMRVNKVRLMVANSLQQVSHKASSTASTIRSSNVSTSVTNGAPTSARKGRMSYFYSSASGSSNEYVPESMYNDAYIETEVDDTVTPNSLPIPSVIFDESLKKHEEEIFDPNEILKTDTLLKQSSKTKEFINRHFILRKGSLIYFNDTNDYNLFMSMSHVAGAPPSLNDPSVKKPTSFGKIYFSEVSTPAGVACSALPNFLSKLLYQRSFVFCIFTEVKSYVIAAPSKDTMQAWISAINEAYSTFVQSYNKQVQAIMDSSMCFGGSDIYTAAESILKSKTAKDVVPELLKMLDDQFSKEAQMLLLYYKKQRIFEAWKLLTKLRNNKEVCV